MGSNIQKIDNPLLIVILIRICNPSETTQDIAQICSAHVKCVKPPLRGALGQNYPRSPQKGGIDSPIFFIF